MLAVSNATRLGVDAIEVDVRFSLDGEPMVVHDRVLERTTDLRGPVCGRLADDLRHCDAAYWWSPGQGETRPDPTLTHPLRGTGVMIPTLRALLEWVASRPDAPHLALEVKWRAEVADDDRGARDTASVVVSLLDEHGLRGRASILSFWLPLLAAVKRLDPALPTCRLTDSAAGVPASTALHDAVEHGHDGAGPNYNAPGLDEDFVSSARARGKDVFTYTVNGPAAQRSILALTPRGLISDWPACTMLLQGRPVPEQVLPKEALSAGAVPIPPCPPASGAAGGGREAGDRP